MAGIKISLSRGDYNTVALTQVADVDYGDGRGVGNSSGSGYGDGNGVGYGVGYGYGASVGYGDGYSDGDGDGDGNGDGAGVGYGVGYGYSASVGYGDGYGDGNGAGDGYGDGYGVSNSNSNEVIGNRYAIPFFTHTVSVWPEKYRTHLFKCCKKGAIIAFWRSDEKGLPCNGGRAPLPIRPGAIEHIDGPLEICTERALHASMQPDVWRGKRLWVVALFGEIQQRGNKFGALHREIIGEI